MTGALGEVLDALGAELAEKRPGTEDMVVVVLEPHVLAADQRSLILTADTVVGRPPAPELVAAEVDSLLDRLPRNGCKVVLFLDGVHTRPAPS